MDMLYNNVLLSLAAMLVQGIHLPNVESAQLGRSLQI